MPHPAQSPPSPHLTVEDAASHHESIKHSSSVNSNHLYGAVKSDAHYIFKHRNGNDTCNNANRTGNHSAAQSAYPLPIGQSPPMIRLNSLIERIAPTNTSVLITGKTGTGKELVARAIHRQSPRRGESFIDINCSAIPDTLFEAEFFGYQRGSFTGALETRRGLLEEASGGILFLDEVDVLSLPGQAKLLRVLQEGYVRRIGGRENIPVNVRILAATSRDLQEAVKEGSFRSDLLFRLRVVPLHVPELRERGREDLRLLVSHFLLRYSQRNGVMPRVFNSEASEALALYHWPGNVRELENAVAYALAVGVDEELGIDDLPPEVTATVNAQHGIIKEYLHQHLSLAEIERRYILTVLESFKGNRAKTALALDLDLRTLNRKLKVYLSVPKSMTAHV
jgi:DNA-binding NtrC family response regulator